MSAFPSMASWGCINYVLETSFKYIDAHVPFSLYSCDLATIKSRCEVVLPKRKIKIHLNNYSLFFSRVMVEILAKGSSNMECYSPHSSIIELLNEWENF